jgi:hypothetical protein
MYINISTVVSDQFSGIYILPNHKYLHAFIHTGTMIQKVLHMNINMYNGFTHHKNKGEI